MADYKSSEGTRKPVEGSNQRIGDTPSKKVTTLECMECGYREVFTEKQFNFTDGLSCYVCNGPVNRVLTRPGEKIRNRRMKEFRKMIKDNIDFASERDYTALGIQVNVDVSDALKGLKAVQKETRKTISFLKELEEYEKGYKDNLLVIELEGENSVPRIYHNGERITQLTDVRFEWLTKTGKPGKTSFNIGYCEKEATGFPLKKGIALDKVNV